MSTQNISPVTLSVLWNGFLSIAEEVGTTLRRTAFSEAVREAEDFSTGIFDRHARLVAQGNFTPGHLGAMPYLVKRVLEYFPPETPSRATAFSSMIVCLGVVTSPIASWSRRLSTANS